MKAVLVISWLVLPSLALALGLYLGVTCNADQPGAFFGAPTLTTPQQRAILEAAPHLAIADAAWQLADIKTTQAITRAELDRLAPEGYERARALVRFALLDSNPDGQAAALSQACIAHAPTCEQLADSARQQAATRWVGAPPALPLSLVGGHP